MGIFTANHYIVVNNLGIGNISPVRAFKLNKDYKSIENEIVTFLRRNSAKDYTAIDRQNLEDIRSKLGDGSWNRVRTQLKQGAVGSISDMGVRQPAERGAGDTLAGGAHVNDDILFREETDEETIERLEREPKVKVYRAMQLIDGELYPPMSAKVNGELRQPTKLGVWERADESPDMADENGKFTLNKGNGKSLKAAYNPYIHTSATMLNDQFSEAQSRPNLVVVEMEVPESEVEGDYRAEKAKIRINTSNQPNLTLWQSNNFNLTKPFPQLIVDNLTAANAVC